MRLTQAERDMCKYAASLYGRPILTKEGKVKRSMDSVIAAMCTDATKVPEHHTMVYEAKKMVNVPCKCRGGCFFCQGSGVVKEEQTREIIDEWEATAALMDWDKWQALMDETRRYLED